MRNAKIEFIHCDWQIWSFSFSFSFSFNHDLWMFDNFLNLSRCQIHKDRSFEFESIFGSLAFKCISFLSSRNQNLSNFIHPDYFSISIWKWKNLIDNQFSSVRSKTYLAKLYLVIWVYHSRLSDLHPQSSAYSSSWCSRKLTFGREDSCQTYAKDFQAGSKLKATVRNEINKESQLILFDLRTLFGHRSTLVQTTALTVCEVERMWISDKICLLKRVTWIFQLQNLTFFTTRKSFLNLRRKHPLETVWRTFVLWRLFSPNSWEHDHFFTQFHADQ
jgi:hypothetical protein